MFGTRIVAAAVLVCAAALVPVAAQESVGSGVTLWLEDIEDPLAGCSTFPLVFEQPEANGTCTYVDQVPASNATGTSIEIQFVTAPLDRDLRIAGTVGVHLEIQGSFPPAVGPMIIEAILLFERTEVATGWLDCTSPLPKASCDVQVEATPTLATANGTLRLRLRIVEGAHQPYIDVPASQVRLEGSAWEGESVTRPEAEDAYLETAPFGGPALLAQLTFGPGGCQVYELAPRLPAGGSSCHSVPDPPQVVFETKEGLPYRIELAGQVRMRLVFETFLDPSEPSLRLTASARDDAGPLGDGAVDCPWMQANATPPPVVCDIAWTTTRADIAKGANVTVVVGFEGTSMGGAYRPDFTSTKERGYTMLVFDNGTWDIPAAPANETASPPTERVPGVLPFLPVLAALALAGLHRRRLQFS